VEVLKIASVIAWWKMLKQVAGFNLETLSLNQPLATLVCFFAFFILFDISVDGSLT